MRTMVPIVLIAALAAGCAAGGGANLPDENLPPGSGLELVVENEQLNTVTAYVEWRGSRGVRLGEVRARNDRTFTVPMRGREVRVTFGSPGSSSSGPRLGNEFVAVNRGDRMEWTLTSNGVFYRRLVAN